MPLKYTGRATLYIPGHDKGYVAGDTVPISKADALNLAARSNLHAFEDVPAPAPAPAPAKAAKPDDN